MIKKLNQIIFIFFCSALFAQETLTLEECYALAQQNYPLIQRTGLIAKTKDYNIENAAKAWLPQINLIGQATYQNDVTQLGIQMPGITIEPLSKDQYKVYADVQQTIYDGGMIANQKKMAEAQADIELQKNQVEIDRLEERINQLYFGVLQTDEQIAQTDITKSDIERAIKQAEAQLKNGVIFRSQLEVLKAQLVSLEQKQIELRSVKKSFLDMLTLFIKKPLSEDTQLIKPEKTLITDQNNRAELKLFDLQTKSLDYQKSILKSKNLPKLGAFFQGGYGKPGMNMLKNEFDWFYIR